MTSLNEVLSNQLNPTDATSSAESPETASPETVKSRRGGKRPGAGRKRRVPEDIATTTQQIANAATQQAIAQAGLTAAELAEQHVSLVAAVTKARYRIGERYPEILDALFDLMEGTEQVQEKYEAAGLIQGGRTDTS